MTVNYPTLGAKNVEVEAKEKFHLLPENQAAFEEAVGQIKTGAQLRNVYDGKTYRIEVIKPSGNFSLLNGSTQPFPASFDSQGWIFQYQEVPPIGFTHDLVIKYNTEISRKKMIALHGGVQLGLPWKQ